MLINIRKCLSNHVVYVLVYYEGYIIGNCNSLSFEFEWLFNAMHGQQLRSCYGEEGPITRWQWDASMSLWLWILYRSSAY